MMKLLIFYMVQKKGSETIALKEGTSRIKLVGKNANGKIRIKIVSEENVYLK